MLDESLKRIRDAHDGHWPQRPEQWEQACRSNDFDLEWVPDRVLPEPMWRGRTIYIPESIHHGPVGTLSMRCAHELVEAMLVADLAVNPEQAHEIASAANWAALSQATLSFEDQDRISRTAASLTIDAKYRQVREGPVTGREAALAEARRMLGADPMSRQARCRAVAMLQTQTEYDLSVLLEE